MGLQVLHGAETIGNEVAVASGAIPTPFVLSSSGQPVATSRIYLASGTAEVRRGTAAICVSECVSAPAMSSNSVLTSVCPEQTQQARTQLRTPHPLDSTAHHMQVNSSSSRETAHMRGTLTKPSKSRPAPSAAAPGQGRGRSRRRVACLLSDHAAQGDAKHMQRKRKRVYAEVCLWGGGVRPELLGKPYLPCCAGPALLFAVSSHTLWHTDSVHMHGDSPRWGGCCLCGPLSVTGHAGAPRRGRCCHSCWRRPA